MSGSAPIVVLLENLTVQDLVRALQFSGVTVSQTIQPNLFVARKGARCLPKGVVAFERPALLRRQAD